jgi:Acyltransferase family
MPKATITESPASSADFHPQMAVSGNPEETAAVVLGRPVYRADIDGLRAVAVTAVVLFHAFPRLLPGGFIGVDIFFVISGYLISSLICENLESGSFTLAEFYIRRIRRIFPALAVVLATVLVVGTFVLLNDEYQQLGKHIAAGSGFVANLALWRESGYFDNSGATKPLLHLWSLGVEEQFYLFWPLALLIAWSDPTSKAWANLAGAERGCPRGRGPHWIWSGHRQRKGLVPRVVGAAANAGDRASYHRGRAGSDQPLDLVEPVAGWNRANQLPALSLALAVVFICSDH